MFDSESDGERIHRSRSPPRAIPSSTSGSSAGTARSQTRRFGEGPARPSAGFASSQAREGEATAPWSVTFASIIAPLVKSLGAQKRALRHRSMYTGMNSQQQIFMLFGIVSVDEVGAEVKDSARRFMKANNILPSKCHVKAEQMLESACDDGERADFFSAGFPCQPWSQMSRKKHPAHLHPLFAQFLNTVKYILRTKPLLALLENVLGFLHQMFVFEGQEWESAFAYLEAQLSHMYSVGFVELNLATWIDVRRPRVFIFCVHYDVEGGEDVVRKAQAFAVSFEEQRRRQPTGFLGPLPAQVRLPRAKGTEGCPWVLTHGFWVRSLICVITLPPLLHPPKYFNLSITNYLCYSPKPKPTLAKLAGQLY